jgi:hypothetical protein
MCVCVCVCVCVCAHARTHIQTCAQIQTDRQTERQQMDTGALLTPSLAYAGAQDSRKNMDWSALPVEMEELIVAKLSLVALARLSSTRKVFKATFCKHLAREQKARCERAACIFGGGRITCIAELVDSFVRKETLQSYLGDGPLSNLYWVAEDGACHAHGRGPAGGDTTHDVQVRVLFSGNVPLGSESHSRHISDSHSMHITVSVGGEQQMYLHLFGQGDKASIFIAANKVDDEGAAMLQALLSQGLAQSLHGVGKRAYLCIIGCTSSPVLTPAEFKFLVCPLLPFVSPPQGFF